MAKNANLYIRVDQNLKTEAEELFSSFGITVTDAVNMFLHKAIMVGGLPFELKKDPDPFYSESNMKRLTNSIAKARAGELTYHEPIEVDDEKSVD